MLIRFVEDVEESYSERLGYFSELTEHEIFHVAQNIPYNSSLLIFILNF